MPRHLYGAEEGKCQPVILGIGAILFAAFGVRVARQKTRKSGF